MEEAGENERQAAEARGAKRPMPRIGDGARRWSGRLEPVAALHLAFVVSLSVRERPPDERLEVAEGGARRWPARWGGSSLGNRGRPR